MPINVTNIQRGCVYDGPGVRTTVFLKGCSLRCPWCCNPETLSKEEDYYIDDTKCILFKGIYSSICENCYRKNGTEPITKCPFGVFKLTSKKHSVDNLISEILRDRNFYINEGGVTFSGGEPLLQAKELEPILSELVKEQINIAFETTLIANDDMLKLVIPYVNLFIIDLKLQKDYSFSSTYLKQILQKIRLIKRQNKDILFRLVVINSMYNYVEDVVKDLQYLEVNNIELLRCHNLGENKYFKLRKHHRDYSCSEVEFNLVASYIEKAGISINCLTL